MTADPPVPIQPPPGFPWRLHRTGAADIDTDEDGAPEVTALDLARQQFARTPWPEAAFHDLIYRRHEIEKAARIPAEELHRAPNTTGMSAELITYLYPDTADQAPGIRWVPPKFATVQRDLYVDSLRLFWEYEQPVELTHSTSFANWVFHDRDIMPGCLFVTVAQELTEKTREILEGYLRALMSANHRAVLIDDSRGRRAKDVLPDDLLLHCAPCPEQ